MIRLSSVFTATFALAFATCALEVDAKDASKSVDSVQTCTSFFIGKWSGEGTVTAAGSPVQLSGTASYKSDGTFTSTSRYLGEDKKWVEQTSMGTWSIEPSPSPKYCFLNMHSESAVAKVNSSIDVEIIDANTYRALGLDLKRVR